MPSLPGLEEFLASLLRLSAPIILAAMGAVLTQRAGIWNIGLEGFMLGGAFAAVAASILTGSAWVGLAAAIAAGAALALLMSFFVVSLRADQFVAGLALNSLALGLTTFLMVEMFHEQQSISSPKIQSLPLVQIPFVSALPGIGAVVSGQSPLVYASWLSVIVVALLVHRTAFGHSIRAVGDSPEAARAAGINPNLIQYATFLLSGAFAGAAGAQLSIGFLSLFEQGMTQGQGYIAFAAVIFGNANPLAVGISGLAFGLAYEISIALTGSAIPNQFVLMTPYVFTIVTLVIVTAGRSKATARGFSALARRSRQVR
jgi:simple sugar transport system permease protein